MTLRPVPVEQARRLAVQTGGSLLAVLVANGDQCAITTYGRTRAECRGLKRWSKHEGDDVVAGIAAWRPWRSHDAAPRRLRREQP